MSEHVKNESELLPCPFCGGDVTMFKPWYCKEEKDQNRRMLKHPFNECILSTVDFCHFDINSLIDRWNNRTTRTEK